MANQTGETVLVTGGSGFLGGWCIIDLLNRGYRVRTTVRDIAREQEVRAALSAEVEAGDRLTFFEADLQRRRWLEGSGRGLRLRAARRLPVPAQAARQSRRSDRAGARRNPARAAREP